MNKATLALLSLFLVLIATKKNSAQAIFNTNDGLQFKLPNADSAFTIKPFANFRLLMVYSGDQLYASDLGTKIGFDFNQAIGKKMSVFGHVELALRIMSNDENFNLSPENSTEEFGFNTATISNPDKVFGLRQTYVGVDFKKYGKVSFGKQNSAYQMIGDRTDISEANSGFASYVFSPTGSDGGLTGTGRANSCLAYQNEFFNRIKFKCGGSFAQNPTSDSVKQVVDAANVSVIVSIYKGFDLAIAYNKTYLSKGITNNKIVYGLNGNPSYLMLGGQFRNKNLLIAANYVTQKYGDYANQDYNDSLNNTLTHSVVYSGTGLEIVAQGFYKRWSILTGTNLKNPEQDEQHFLNSGFQTHLIFYGLQYFLTPKIYCYFEGRVENSKDVNGVKIGGTNVIGITVGL